MFWRKREETGEKKLEINPSTMIRSYAHHAFVNAILEGKRENELLVMHVEEDAGIDWKKEEEKLSWEIEQDIVKLVGNKYEVNSESILWRECKEEDSISVWIDYFRCTNADAILNLFVTTENVCSNIEKNREIFRMGYLARGIVLPRYDNQFFGLEEQVSNIIGMRLAYNKDYFVLSVARKEHAWKRIFEYPVPDAMKGKKLRIGVDVNMGEDDYYNWRSMNFIQLWYGDKDEFVWLDYYLFPRKSYSYVYSQNFLDVHTTTGEEIIDDYSDIHCFLKKSIQHEYYVDLDLDEFYVQNRSAFGKVHYNHENLIYGYDDEKRVYYLLGYHGKLVDGIIPFESLSQAFTPTKRVKRYKKSVNTNRMRFSLEFVIRNIQDFLDGINSSERTGNVMPIQEGVFGLHVFVELVTNEQARRMLTDDVRITYVLYEHTLLLREQLVFLIYREYIDVE